LRHAVTSGSAAWPRRALGTGALLGQFGRIQAKQPDAVIAQAETVAIAGAT
jgi:hypothetical protein